MKGTFIIIFLLLSFQGYCQIGQKGKPEKIQEVSDSVFWATISILNYWEYITTSGGDFKWYISKKEYSKMENYLEIPVMLYAPIWRHTNNHIYKDVIINETVLFDCVEKKYKILKAKYSFGFVNVFDIVQNNEGSFSNVAEKSTWSKLLAYSCMLK